MKNLIITLAALMLVLACKKERIQYLSDDIKKNYSYKPGTYWIYKDSATGREDSCYVYSNYINFIDNTKDRSAFNGYDKVEYISVVIKGYIHIEINIFNSGLNSALLFYSNPQTFGCPLPINQQTVYGSDEFLPSISLQGKEFLNTFKINDDFGLYYFNESIGIIKMKVTNDSVAYNWELVRHKVLK